MLFFSALLMSISDLVCVYLGYLYEASIGMSVVLILTWNAPLQFIYLRVMMPTIAIELIGVHIVYVYVLQCTTSVLQCTVIIAPTLYARVHTCAYYL